MTTVVDAVDVVAESDDLTVVHEIVLTKSAAKSLDDAKSQAQIDEAIAGVMTIERQRKGWTLTYIDQPRRWSQSSRFMRRGDGVSGYKYSVKLQATCKPNKQRSTLAQEFDNIVASLDQRIKSPRVRWQVAETDGEAYVPREVEKFAIDANEQVMYAPLEMPADDEWTNAFRGMFGMDDYITVIRSALETALDSNWEKRINVLLQGPPACGKTDLCKRLKKLLGNEAVLEFDATSTTMAGAQQMLNEREEMPRVLIVEEIEKAPEASLQWLLSVLDLRGEIRKTTARGNVLKEVHMIGIATVNNVNLFNRLAAGALSSRFPMPLEFRRPSDEILSLILAREIEAVGGDLAWIEPTIQYAHRIGSTDPRQLTAICLTGRERLLDGSYQAIMARVMRHATPDKQDSDDTTEFAF